MCNNNDFLHESEDFIQKCDKLNLDEILALQHGKKVYVCTNAQLTQHQLECQELLYEYNMLRPSQQEQKSALLKKMFASVGENCYIQPPFYANWAGRFVHIGKNFYANFNLTLVDDTHIYIGDNVFIAPNVVLTTAEHVIEPNLRSKTAQYNLPITIGSNVWIGANSVVLAGVSIGDNTVIGAGSIVTHDIEANVVAFGAPCKVRRKINEQDLIKAKSLMPNLA